MSAFQQFYLHPAQTGATVSGILLRTRMILERPTLPPRVRRKHFALLRESMQVSPNRQLPAGFPFGTADWTSYSSV